MLFLFFVYYSSFVHIYFVDKRDLLILEASGVWVARGVLIPYI